MSDLPEFSDEIEIPAELSDAVEKSTATPETYDRRLVQDHTGLLFQAIARMNREDQFKLLGDAKLFTCTRRVPRICHSDLFRVLSGPDALVACSQCMSFAFKVLASTHDNHIQIFCANRECKATFPSLEITHTGGKRELPQHVQFICFEQDCGAAFPVLELSPVQMNDQIAKAHGLYIPDPKVMRKPRGVPGRRN